MEIYLVFKKWKCNFLIYIDFHLFLCLFPHLSVIFPSIYAFIHRLTASIAVIYCLDITGHLKVTSFLWLHIFKMSTLCKAIYRFNAILIKISILIFIELQLIYLKCGCNQKKLNFQSNLGIKRTKLKFYAP